MRQRECDIGNYGIEFCPDRALVDYFYMVGGYSTSPKTPESVYPRVVSLCKRPGGPITRVKKGIISNRVFDEAVGLGPMEAGLFRDRIVLSPVMPVDAF